MSETDSASRPLSPIGTTGSEASPVDLLLDVELDATIRFGERQLLLCEVLSAAPGSILELDRDLQAPADLLVAGRLIARGEVVVVGGHFGLRVTELVASGRPA